MIIAEIILHHLTVARKISFGNWEVCEKGKESEK